MPLIRLRPLPQAVYGELNKQMAAIAAMSAKTDREHADVTRSINTLYDRFTEAQRMSAAAGASYEMLFSTIGNEIERLAVEHLETRAEVKGLATEMGQVASSGHTSPSWTRTRPASVSVPASPADISRM